MIHAVTIQALQCTCNKCGCGWTVIGDKVPTYCHNQECRSREWNGKKRPIYSKEIKLPPPRQGGRPKVKPFFDYTEDP